MAMGRREERQGDLMMAWDELPRSPGHAFYGELQRLLFEAAFDAFVEDSAFRAIATRHSG